MSGMAASRTLQRIIRNPRLKVIFYGSTSAALSKALTTLVSLVSLPLTIHYLGPEHYGVWVTIISTTTWIAILEFGLTDTLTNTISATHAAGDKATAARHTANALVVAFCFACLMFALGALVWPHIDWVSFFNVKKDVDPSEIRNTVAVAYSLILFAPMCSIGSHILLGYQQAHLVNLVTALGAVVSMAGLVVGIYLHLTMPLLFLCATGFVPLSGLGTLLWIILIGKPWLRPRARHLEVRLATNLMRAGAPYFLIRIAGIVVFSTDNLVVGHFLGAAQVTPYSVGMSFVMYAQLIPSFLFPSLWATYAEANARGDMEWIRRAYSCATRSCMVMICAIVVCLAFYGRWLIGIWAGQSAVPSEFLLLCMCIWTLILGVTTMQSCLLGAVGRTKVQAIAGIASAVLNLALSIVLVQKMGSIGAVLGTILSYAGILILQKREVSSYFRGG